MSQRRKKKNQVKVANYNIPSVSEDKLIEIHAEAYYKALKKIEEDKLKEEREADLSDDRNYKWYDYVLVLLNIIIWPWKINKRVKINNRIYESILVIVIFMILESIGMIAWILGWLVLLFSLVNKLRRIMQMDAMLKGVMLGIILLMLGGMFLLAAQQFNNEKDSNRIYAYSSSIIALISCIASIIALCNVL